MTDRDPAVAEALERTRSRPSGAADWDDVVRRATTPQGDAAPRRPLARAMRWAPSLAGGIAIAAVLGVMAVRQADAPPSAAPAGVTGVEALVRVTSIREDQTDEQAAERMERVLTDRARIQGITGFAIERSGAELSVFVPRTQRPEWVGAWVPASQEPVVYDLGASVIARGEDPIAVASEVGGAQPGVPTVFYIVARGATVDTSGAYGPLATRAEAEALLARVRGGAGVVRVMSVPASVRLLIASRIQGDPDSGLVFLALRDPLVSASEIAEVRASGNRVDIEVAPATRARLAAAVRGGARPFIVQQGVVEIPFVRFDASAGSLVFRSRHALWAREVAFNAAGGGVDAVSSIVRSRRVGPVPAPVGTPVVRPGRDVGPPPTPPDLEVVESTVRKVLELRGPSGGSWWVWAAKMRNGHDGVGVVNRGRASMLGTCDVDPRRPLLHVCMGGGSYGRRVLVGRAGAAVHTITAVTEKGVRAEGRAGNGHFLLLVPPRAGAIRVLILRDARGAEVGRVSHDDPFLGLMLGGLR